MSIKTLPAKDYLRHTSEFNLRQWGPEVLPEGVSYLDLFEPEFWKHHASKLKAHELIRVRAADGSFDLNLVVVARVPDGLKVEAWPKLPSQVLMDEAASERTTVLKVRKINGENVPRVEYGRAVKWRVIGTDGNEVSHGHESKELATAAMHTYVESLGKTLEA